MKKHRNFILVHLGLIFCFTTSTYAQRLPDPYTSSIKKSYVRTWDMTKPAFNLSQLSTAPLKDVKQSTLYFDGLGRPLQTVIKQGSLQTSGTVLSDMVIPVEYDEFGREKYKWLAFASSNSDGNFKLNPYQQQSSFYSNSNGVLANQGETWFYGQLNFESSPLNRIEKSLSAGNSWNGAANGGKGIENKYWVNTTTDDIKKWNVTDVTNSFGTYSINSSYPAGELYKNGLVDEHGKQVIEFTDKEGKVILKKVQLTATADDGTGKNYSGWLCTYYIYDDFNNLRCVVQPEGVKALANSSWSLTTTILNEQCFRYEFDERNRMIKKKVPGAGEVWMVYDKRDRLVLSQHANLRSQNKWMFTKYDQLNRPILTGFYTNTSQTTQHDMQSFLYTQNLAFYETYNPSNYPLYTLNQSFPVVSFSDVLTVTYYDDYTWAGWYGSYATKDNSYDSYFYTPNNSNDPYPQPLTQSNATKGFVTGVWESTSGGLLTASYYDDKGRVIQTKSYNQKAGIDIITTQYNWAGQPLMTVLKTEITGSNAQTTIVVTKMIYDDLGRITKIEKKQSNSLVTVNGQMGAMSDYATIATMEYDALGQLVKKIIGSKKDPATNNYYSPRQQLEDLSYEYNIRGWMLGMNRQYAKDANNNNWFGFDLGFDKADNKIIGGQTYSNPQLNGNIEGMVWKSKGDGEKRRYDFYYDAANRLLRADFGQYDGSAFNLSAQVDYKVKMGDGINVSSAYDDNGNILQMQQWGLKLNASPQIDNLGYTYQTGSNKLSKVYDAITTENKMGDFFDGTNGTNTDYNYDVNGNLTLDNNKAISSITYNHLNLPLTITVTGKGDITYTYDAGGSKLKKLTNEYGATVPYNGTNYTTNITTTTIYLAGAVYESKSYSNSTVNTGLGYTDRLQFISHEEGRIRFKQDNNTLHYDYFIKDHLGNVRMVLTEELNQDKYPVASMEDSKVNTEDDYYTIDASKIVLGTTVTGLPTYTNDNGIGNNPSDPTFEAANSTKLYKLNSTANKTGLGITLKVMTGDRIDIHGKSYYFQNNTGGSGANTAITTLELLTGFLGGPLGGTASNAHGGVTASQLNGYSGTTTGITSLLNSQTTESNNAPTVPKAYINYIFFDEQLKCINTGFSKVGTNSVLKSHFSELQNLTAQKNGYVFIYVSNESPVNVFFDNLQVVHTRSALLEETHYYPFGLAMSGISSKTLNFGNPQNKFKFNGIEHNIDLDLNIYETFYRNLDPQIGRWWSVDTKPQKSSSLYVSMNNNPIINLDWFGDTTYYYNQEGEWFYTAYDASRINYVKVDQDKFFEVFFTIGFTSQDGWDKKVAYMNTTLWRMGDRDMQSYIAFGNGEMNMEFTGSTANTVDLLGHGLSDLSGEPLYADGKLNLNLRFSDGTALKIMSIDARSGPWDYSAIPNGDYEIDAVIATTEKGMYRDGVGFKVRISKNIEHNRSALYAHPDEVSSRSKKGTAGCIGLVCDKATLLQFRNTTVRYLDNHNLINLNVNILNNPNYTNDGRKDKNKSGQN